MRMLVFHYESVERGMVSSTPFSDAHQALIERLRTMGELYDPRVEKAFMSVPRHLFLPNISEDRAYTDESIVVKKNAQGEVLCSSILPSMMARMLNHIDIQEGQNILEIGSGTGYSAALMRKVVGSSGTITSIEIDPSNANAAQDNLLRAKISGVNIVNADGAQGYAPRAMYDRIVSTVGVWDIPSTWFGQLKPKGKLIVPIWLDGLQVVATFTANADGTFYSDHNSAGVFIYMTGAEKLPAIQKRVGSTALSLLSDQTSKIDTAALHLLLSHDQEHCHLSTSLSTHEYWYGFIPYAMINEPSDSIFVLYEVLEGQKAYGIEDKGFGVFTPGSAVFVPYDGMGYAHCFAGSDAFISLESSLDNWNDAGRPGMKALRLRIIPKQNNIKPSITHGKLYERRHNYLHVWQEM